MDLTSWLSGVEGERQAEGAVVRAIGTICDAWRPNSEVRDIAGHPTAADTQILQESRADSSMCAVQKRSLLRDSEKWAAFPVAGKRC